MSARHDRILVVDDDPAVCRIVERALNAAHEVVTETDARAALSRIGQGERFDMILCDVMMPTMSGVDLYRAIQSAQPDMAKRIVFVTGGAFSPGAGEFLKDVGNPVLQKAVQTSEPPGDRDGIHRLKGYLPRLLETSGSQISTPHGTTSSDKSWHAAPLLASRPRTKVRRAAC